LPPVLEGHKCSQQFAAIVYVRGIIPDEEIEAREKIKETTGARFEFEPVNKYRKFMPPISPCLVGVSKEKVILFVLPSVPGQENI